MSDEADEVTTPRAGRRDLRLWPLRVLWATLPLTAGPLLADALDPTRGGFRRAVSIGLWVLWAIALLATFVPRVVTLTPARVVVPAAVPATVWAAATGRGSTLAATVGVAAAVAVAFAALAAATGDGFADGSSYGDERRMLLRPPTAVLLGPLPLVWALTVAAVTAGPLLLADQHWVAGAAATAVGAAVVRFTSRSLHLLARRWVVFVPAGLVVHDHLALAEPTLFARNSITRLGPAEPDALADPATIDATVAAPGLVLAVEVAPPQQVTPVRLGRGKGAPPLEPREISCVLVVPTRPGALLAEARRRRIRVG
jgi:hypothetical protein